MTPISASDVAEALAAIPVRHADKFLTELHKSSAGAAKSVREHVDRIRKTRAGGLPDKETTALAEQNKVGRKKIAAGRRLPDTVTDEICEVLIDRDQPVGFNDLFERVFEGLKAKNAVSGGEEMLRLRAYEKLQNLVTKGQAAKYGKEYGHTQSTVRATSAWLAEHA